MKDVSANHDHFLASAVRPHHTSQLTFMDGFRFALGFFIGTSLLLLVLGVLTWGFIMVFHLH